MQSRVGPVFVFFMLALILFPPASATGAAVMITNIQYWLAPDHIQTIISFDHAVQPSYHYRDNPDRFVLEIPNCQPHQGGHHIPVNDVALERIRVQRLNNGTTQVVFDLPQKLDATVQTLPALNGQPDHVVVNLFDVTHEEQSQQQRAERRELTTQLKQQAHYIVVLDPGHGGRDPGAIGKNGLKEKDVVLDLARKMKSLIEANAPNITVFLTRDDDYFLPLQRRTEIAEEYHADLFISLHVNANPNRKVHGFSVYTLSENATDAAARELAKKENAVDMLFGGVATPAPLEDDSLLTFVLADLTKTAALQNSLEYGRIAMDTTIANLKEFKVYKEGLKRANFKVLRTAAMPAALVEACYISNKREESLLNRKDFRMKVAASLAKSTIRYFAQRRNSVNPQQVASLETVPQPAAAPEQPKVHVVKSGESLSVIAGRYNVNLARLRQINKLASADLIYVGQRLWIP